jgi:hypothetical protein
MVTRKIDLLAVIAVQIAVQIKKGLKVKNSETFI